MALRGTLKNFGIADIFQLIGHQGKSGALTVKNRDEAVVVHFADGNIVGSEVLPRKDRDLLGRMLIRAEVITEEQLEAALLAQSKTGRRIGELLLEAQAIDPATLNSFARLQTTETLYRLFLWDGGSYEFSQTAGGEVKGDLIRSELVLMEGFRQVDEWPTIRKKIHAYGLIFERQEDLDALIAAAGSHATDELNFGNDFGDADSGSSATSDPRLKNIGQNERIIYQLVQPERDVQKIIDLSRLGEFETCKALATLVDAGIIRAQTLSKPREVLPEATVGGIQAPSRLINRFTVVRAVLLFIMAAGMLVVWRLNRADFSFHLSENVFHDTRLKRELSAAPLQKIHTALGVYAALAGVYPGNLRELVTLGLLSEDDLRFPWQQDYAYIKNESGYRLLAPFF